MISMRVFGTPVKVKATILPDLFVLWGGVTWWGLRRHHGRPIWRGLLIGLASTVVLLPVDFGHAVAHIFSARFAGAPMDEIWISAGMPRTIYFNNEVPPEVHRMRALGGPIYSALGLLISGSLRRRARPNSVPRELAGWSALGHGAILAFSLAPVPPVDGGAILKWTLVARGKAPSEADQAVRRIDWAMGAAGGTIGLGLLARRKWVPGLVAAGLGLLVTAIAAGKVR